MFQQVAVIGAGTMGAGIAGQVANSGVEVLLLDLPSDDADDANAIARRGLARVREASPSGLMGDDAIGRIRLGNVRDDLEAVAHCDWVAEAVVERVDVKHDLYRRLESHLRDDAILTSNTSTLPIRVLTEGMPTARRRRFAITHFFNPVRFMQLLELVRGESTSDDVIVQLADFCEARLGKGVVNCIDTPGFLANRVGCYALQCALHEAFARGLTPAEADAVFGRPLGIPKTGVFGLYDLIGIDLMADVTTSLIDTLPPDDAFHAVAEPIPLMTRMIEEGRTGNKSGQGFYRRTDDGHHQMLDLATGEYVSHEPAGITIAERAERDGMGHLLADDSAYGAYAWRVLSQTLVYAASLIPEVGRDPVAIDDAMKLGYNWIRGPFELIDTIGVDAFVTRLEGESRGVPPLLDRARDRGFYRVVDSTLERIEWRDDRTIWRPLERPDGVLRFSAVRRTLAAESSNASASWFEFEGAAVVEFHTKANALDGDSMAILADALARIPVQGLNGLVVHNDAQHFSCGVNLARVREFFRTEDWEGLDAFLHEFQQTVHAMATADFPVVAAPVGLSIGGGFEVVLHAQHVVAHANSVLGLVESLVGLIPAGGGCKETLYRWIEALDLEPDAIEAAAWRAFKNIGYGRTTTSPAEARAQAMLRPSDASLMNRDRLLRHALDAVERGLSRPRKQRPPLAMPGREVAEAMGRWLDEGLSERRFTPHDTVVGRALATVVAGDCPAGTTWGEQELFDAERRAFLALVKTDATQARIDSMLDGGRPVRN